METSQVRHQKVRRWQVLAVLAMLLGLCLPTNAAPVADTPLPPPVALPGTNTKSFTPDVTRETITGIFLDYWNVNGNIPQQGYPISPVIGEKSDLNGQLYTMQYFERAVFEYHPNERPPFNVLLSQLGTFQYRKKYPNGASNQKASTDNPRSFPAVLTTHVIGGKFRAYWENNGSTAQQGYPLSDEFAEVSDLNGKPYIVQYFERAVFELHPEQTDPKYEVLLSQLGTFRYKEKYQGGAGTGTPVPSGTPGPNATPRPGNTPAAGDCSGIPAVTPDDRVLVKPNCGTVGTTLVITVNGLVPRQHILIYTTPPGSNDDVKADRCNNDTGYEIIGDASGAGEATCGYVIRADDRNGLWKVTATIQEKDYVSYFKVYGTRSLSSTQVSPFRATGGGKDMWWLEALRLSGR